MKKTLVVFAILAGSVAAYAVSIDFVVFSAVQIGDLQTEKSDDGLTVQHRIEFSGPNLATFAKLLPIVTDEDRVVPGLHMVNITNAGQEGVAEDKATSIYLECTIPSDKGADTKCNITIIKGAIPG